MLHLTLLSLLIVAGSNHSNQTEGYYDAYARANKESRPLVVIVGADWCAACKKMKHNTIEPMREEGKLKEVILTHVDLDEQPELAEQIMTGKSLPQIIVFAKGNGGWKRFSASGMQSEKRVRELIRRAEAVLPALERR